MEYLELLQKNLAEEIDATRTYAATIAVAPMEDIPTILEILADETDHIALIATLISKQTAQDIDYKRMVPNVD